MKASRLRASSVLLAALLIGLLAGSACAQAPREIVIGVIYALSGNLAQIGIDSVTAIRMATEIFNGRSRLNLPSARKTTDGLPGLGGAKIRLVVVDHQGKPELGQAEAERLITQEKVTALLGSVHSSVTATASQVAERYGVPFMNGEVGPAQPPGRGRKTRVWPTRSATA
jgi:branched-chain amino acid transport system substrate-binding protein